VYVIYIQYIFIYIPAAGSFVYQYLFCVVLRSDISSVYTLCFLQVIRPPDCVALNTTLY
jgi:hypothetical protein